jgi:hypothetical protein
MKSTRALFAGASLAIAPTAILAAPGNSQGSTNGNGWDHLNGPAPGSTGQPSQSCEDVGITPGHSAGAPGGGSPFGGEDSTAGSHYAGTQPQNTRNNSSVSQYDVACVNQLPH